MQILGLCTSPAPLQAVPAECYFTPQIRFVHPDEKFYIKNEGKIFVETVFFKREDGTEREVQFPYLHGVIENGFTVRVSMSKLIATGAMPANCDCATAISAIENIKFSCVMGDDKRVHYAIA